MEPVSAALTLFFVLDPIGNVPLVVALLKDTHPHRRRWIILRESLIALAILLIFLFTGPYILNLFNIADPALRIAGGVILFIVAIRMIFPAFKGVFGDEQLTGEPLIVPLAVPLLAGPSAIAVVTLLASTYPDHTTLNILALFLAWIPSTLILLLAPTLQRLLSQRGIIAVERLMGLILTIIAVQMTLDGLQSFFQS